MSVSFNLTPSEDGYTLQMGLLGSQKSVTFSQTTKPAEGETLDLYSQNGSFTEKDAHDLEKAIEKTKETPHDQTLLVLDLKNSGGEYLGDLESIAKTEKVALEFFSQTYPQFSFVLFEGSLKIDILNSGIFSKAEIDFLQKDPSGKIAFCQIAEFFMNAFKFGQTVTCNGHTFSFEKYIHPIKGGTFQPRSKSVVLYPSLYKNIYSLDSAVANCFKSVFNIGGSFHKKSKITTWEVTKK